MMQDLLPLNYETHEKLMVNNDGVMPIRMKVADDKFVIFTGLTSDQFSQLTTTERVLYFDAIKESNEDVIDALKVEAIERALIIRSL